MLWLSGFFLALATVFAQRILNNITGQIGIFLDRCSVARRRTHCHFSPIFLGAGKRIICMTRIALELIGRAGLGHSFDALDSDETPAYIASVKITLMRMALAVQYILPWASGIGSARFHRFIVTSLAIKTLKHPSHCGRGVGLFCSIGRGEELEDRLKMGSSATHGTVAWADVYRVSASTQIMLHLARGHARESELCLDGSENNEKKSAIEAAQMGGRESTIAKSGFAGALQLKRNRFPSFWPSACSSAAHDLFGSITPSLTRCALPGSSTSESFSSATLSTPNRRSRVVSAQQRRVWLKLLEHPVGIAILSVLDVNGGRALVSGIRGERIPHSAAADSPSSPPLPQDLLQPPARPRNLSKLGSWRVASASVQECEECGAVNGVSTPPRLPAHTSATNPQPPPEQSQGFRQFHLQRVELFRYCTTAPQDDIGNERRCRYFGGNYDLTLEKVVMQSEWWLEGAEGAEVEVVVKGIPDVKNFVGNLCKGPQEIVEEGPRK
ncbi:hypothetical protein B0H13DRAFT_1865913 [Mycena leptocephala]|nr:hypothetical protein B0H13DRAFT_1865913 [Mycena leptocephala]